MMNLKKNPMRIMSWLSLPERCERTRVGLDGRTPPRRCSRRRRIEKIASLYVMNARSLDNSVVERKNKSL